MIVKNKRALSLYRYIYIIIIYWIYKINICYYSIYMCVCVRLLPLQILILKIKKNVLFSLSIYIYIYHHGVPLAQISLTPLDSRLYRPSLPVCLPCNILYQNRAVVVRFLLVAQPLFVRVKGSTAVHRLWVRPYFSNSVPHVLFVSFG